MAWGLGSKEHALRFQDYGVRLPGLAFVFLGVRIAVHESGFKECGLGTMAYGF